MTYLLLSSISLRSSCIAPRRVGLNLSPNFLAISASNWSFWDPYSQYFIDCIWLDWAAHLKNSFRATSALNHTGSPASLAPSLPRVSIIRWILIFMESMLIADCICTISRTCPLIQVKSCMKPLNFSLNSPERTTRTYQIISLGPSRGLFRTYMCFACGRSRHWMHNLRCLREVKTHNIRTWKNFLWSSQTSVICNKKEIHSFSYRNHWLYFQVCQRLRPAQVQGPREWTRVCSNVARWKGSWPMAKVLFDKRGWQMRRGRTDHWKMDHCNPVIVLHSICL